MVRALDRFYARHPRIAITMAVLVAFTCLYLARDWDTADTAALRLQMTAARNT